MAKKQKIECLTNIDHEYILCEQCQNYEQGKPITTKFDMDLCDTLDDFLEVLFDAGEITESEKNNIMNVYYKKEV